MTTGGAGFGIGGTQTVTGGVALTMNHTPWTIGQSVMTLHTPNTTITTAWVLPGDFASRPGLAHFQHSPNLGRVQQALGHSDSRSTQRYAKFTDESAAEVFHLSPRRPKQG